jgi:hypothetical protein
MLKFTAEAMYVCVCSLTIIIHEGSITSFSKTFYTYDTQTSSCLSWTYGMQLVQVD